MTESLLPPPGRDRMAGRYFTQCPACRTHRVLGPCCAGDGPVPPKTTRHRERAALRRHVDDLLATDPADPLVDPSDCRHGCNGMCVESGSERCDFTCHPEEDEPDDGSPARRYP